VKEKELGSSGGKRGGRCAELFRGGTKTKEAKERTAVEPREELPVKNQRTRICGDEKDNKMQSKRQQRKEEEGRWNEGSCLWLHGTGSKTTG